jgi:hypothetical protein
MRERYLRIRGKECRKIIIDYEKEKYLSESYKERNIKNLN